MLEATIDILDKVEILLDHSSTILSWKTGADDAGVGGV